MTLAHLLPCWVISKLFSLFILLALSFFFVEYVDGSNTKGSLIDSENTIYINSKPLNTLIPGMSTDPYSARARAKSTGLAKEYFKQLYTQLLPYYVDLRDGNKDSTKILHDFGNHPQECGKVINLLVGLGQCHVLDDWKKVYFFTKKMSGIVL
jgi:recyclin-1